MCKWFCWAFYKLKSNGWMIFKCFLFSILCLCLYICYICSFLTPNYCHPMILSWQNVCSWFLCQKINIIEVFSWHFNQRKHMVLHFWIDLNPLLFRGSIKRRLSLVVCIYMYIFMALSFKLLVAFWHKATTTQNILWLIEIIARSWVKIKWN
jgi:hypothetical protein